MWARMPHLGEFERQTTTQNLVGSDGQGSEVWKRVEKDSAGQSMLEQHLDHPSHLSFEEFEQLENLMVE